MKRIPGVRHYRAVDSGLRELGMSSAMSSAMVDAAQKLAGNVNAVADGTYEAAPETVRGGWANEPRAGAVVRETEHHWRDARDAVLLRVVEAMKVRSR